MWELLVDGESAGYFELYRHDDGSVEIDYFGLIPKFIGRGLGGWMLTRAVEEAWAMDASRVWLHTCTLDSPRALPGYKARGFREFKTERLEVEIEGTQVASERLLHDSENIGNAPRARCGTWCMRTNRGMSDAADLVSESDLQ